MRTERGGDRQEVVLHEIIREKRIEIAALETEVSVLTTALKRAQSGRTSPETFRDAIREAIRQSPSGARAATVTKWLDQNWGRSRGMKNLRIRVGKELWKLVSLGEVKKDNEGLYRPV